MGVLFDELSALYAAHREGRDAQLAALPVQYADLSPDYAACSVTRRSSPDACPCWNQQITYRG
jgi:hypothetical protein